jgi:hypothetical protein
LVPVDKKDEDTRESMSSMIYAWQKVHVSERARASRLSLLITFHTKSIEAKKANPIAKKTRPGRPDLIVSTTKNAIRAHTNDTLQRSTAQFAHSMISTSRTCLCPPPGSATWHCAHFVLKIFAPVLLLLLFRRERERRKYVSK